MKVDLTVPIQALDFEYYEKLDESPLTYLIKAEKTGLSDSTPTLISVCPNCQDKVKWHTHGALPSSLICKCGKEFKVNFKTIINKKTP